MDSGSDDHHHESEHLMEMIEQIRIVNELFDAMQTKIVGQLVSQKIPAEWDGHQLRMLVALHAKENAERSVRAVGKKGVEDFANTVIVMNL